MLTLPEAVNSKNSSEFIPYHTIFHWVFLLSLSLFSNFCQRQHNQGFLSDFRYVLRRKKSETYKMFSPNWPNIHSGGFVPKLCGNYSHFQDISKTASGWKNHVKFFLSRMRSFFPSLLLLKKIRITLFAKYQQYCTMTSVKTSGISIRIFHLLQQSSKR